MISEEIRQKFLDYNLEKIAEKKAFLNRVGCPYPKDIDCLNLIMKKEFALQIVEGKKNIEYRPYSQHYRSRLVDADVEKFVDQHIDNEEIQAEVPYFGFCDGFREVKKIHFHNYSNSWYLDVEVVDNCIAIARKEDAEVMEMYDGGELLALSNSLDEKKENERPIFFYFILGHVLDTNLK